MSSISKGESAHCSIFHQWLQLIIFEVFWPEIASIGQELHEYLIVLLNPTLQDSRNESIKRISKLDEADCILALQGEVAN